MSDFNAILGNTNGAWWNWSQVQVDGIIYTADYLSDLELNATLGEPSRKEVTAQSQGIFENSVNARPRFECIMQKAITKIGGVYDFKKRFYFNETLTRAQVLDYVIAKDIVGLLALASTEEMTIANGGGPFIDAILGGT